MITSLSINNFKCFEQIEAAGLSHFNIVVGRNGSGKTALLEALFLVAGTNPSIAVKANAMRGMGGELEIRNDRQSYEALWRDLFCSFDQSKTIHISLKGTVENTRSLLIAYEKPESETLPFGTQPAHPVETVPISFSWRNGLGQESKATPIFTPKGLSFGDQFEGFPTIFLTPVARESPVENGRRFSDLSKKGKDGRFTSAIKKEFEMIEGLSIEYHAGSAIIHASVRSLQQKIPLPYVSDGINKLCSILLALESFSGGLVLVDEIENGFYSGTMKSISRMLLDMAKQCSTQLIVTTHSMEYLRSVLPLIEKHPEDFSLLRTVRDNGASAVEQLDGSQLLAALQEGFEVR